MQNKSREAFRFSFSGLNSQIFFFVILPISLLLLAVTFGSMALHQGAMRNLVGERDQRTVRSAASAIREQLIHRASAIQGLAIRAGDQTPIDEILGSVDFLRPDFEAGIAVLSPEGELIAANRSEEIWQDIAGEISSNVEELTSEISPAPQFSEPFLHPTQNEYFALVLYQTNANSPIAVGVYSVTSLARQTLTGTLSMENQGAVVLADRARKLLFASGSMDLIKHTETHPGISEALLGESGTTYFMAEDGEHVVAFSPVAPTNWALVMEEPWHTVANPLLRYSETGSLVLVPIVVFALFALWFGTRKIIQPLNTLQRQAIAFTQGNFTAFNQPTGGINEIQILHTTFENMAREVEEAQQTLKKYLGMITAGQEDERKRLARELHDDTLQSLIALNQRVMMVKRMAGAVGLQDALQEIESMVSQTMDELRRLTRALRPIYLEDLGLVTALETLAHETSQTSDVQVGFTASGEERRLPDATEIALFRISQEALSNIVRHSKATKAEIAIAYLPKSIKLVISDNGTGFDLPENLSDLSNRGHFGLLGIQERAELISAELEISSEAGAGTQLILRV